jgi:hypothetical protein
MQPLATTFKHAVEESIPLSPAEKISQQTRNELNTFRSTAPTPCLWITAHVGDPIDRTKNAALDKLSKDLGSLGTTDLIANAYREFLQKQLIRLNHKLLNYKKTGLCFHFRGTLERNAADPAGRLLHYHFSLWAPNNLFGTDPSLMQKTKQKLIALWHQRVNTQGTQRHKPIHIDIINTQQDADHIANYEAKANPMTHAYEIFDDWSLAGCAPVPT